MKPGSKKKRNWRANSNLMSSQISKLWTKAKRSKKTRSLKSFLKYLSTSLSCSDRRLTLLKSKSREKAAVSRLATMTKRVKLRTSTSLKLRRRSSALPRDSEGKLVIENLM